MNSIKIKNFIFFFVTISVIVCITSVIIYLRAKNEVQTAILDKLQTELKYEQIKINDGLLKIKRAGEYLNYSRYVYELITTKTDDDVTANNIINYIKLEYSNAYDMLLREDNSLIYTNVLFVDKNLACASKMVPAHLNSYSNNNVFTNEYVEDEQWYKETLTADSEIYFFREKEEPDLLYVSHVLRSSFDIDHALGVSVAKINLTNMAHSIGTSTNGITIVLTESDSLFQELGVNQLINGTPSKVTMDNQVYFMNSLQVYSTVHIVTLLSENAVLRNVHELKRVIILLCMLIFPIGIAISFWCSNVLTKPILKLVLIMRNADVLYGKSIDHVSQPKDEVGALYKAFADMLCRIRKLVSEKQALSEKEKEAEINALQAQINPHFICNVLNTASMRALGRDQDDIADVLRLLAKILRYNINDMSKLVPIVDELAFIETYMEIQRSLYGPGIKIEFDIPKELSYMKIIRCIIQPLVENSILHGIQESDYAINIQIKAYTTENQLCVEVTDDGAGCDTGLLNEALKKDIPIKEGSIGCININRRIFLRFGGSFGLRYLPWEKGTKAFLTFPKIKDN